MRHKLLTVFSLALFLSACGSTSPTKTASFNQALLSGIWFLNQSNGNTQEWRKTKPSDLRRFQPKMTFSPPQTFKTKILHPTDRHYSVSGSYSISGNTVSTRYQLGGAAQHETPSRMNKLIQKQFEVISISPQVLLIQP